MQLSSPVARSAVLRALLWAVLLCLVGYTAFIGDLFPGHMEEARRVSCHSNLWQLGLAATSYAMDWDGHLPPRPTEGDWIARRWRAFPLRVGLGWRYKAIPTLSGPFDTYAKNAGIYGCPSDPKHRRNTAVARSSYDWNYALAGQLLEEVPMRPLAWDRAPFHRGGRNLTWTSEQATQTPPWLKEGAFQEMMAREPQAR